MLQLNMVLVGITEQGVSSLTLRGWCWVRLAEILRRRLGWEWNIGQVCTVSREWLVGEASEGYRIVQVSDYVSLLLEYHIARR